MLCKQVAREEAAGSDRDHGAGLKAFDSQLRDPMQADVEL